jgi:hypothetical protein
MKKQTTLSLCSYYPWLCGIWSSLTKLRYIIYNSYSSDTRYRTCKMQFKASAREDCFIYPTKEDNQTFYMSFLVNVLQHVCTPNIILLLKVINNLLNIINCDNSDSIIILIKDIKNTPMLDCAHLHTRLSYYQDTVTLERLNLNQPHICSQRYIHGIYNLKLSRRLNSIKSSRAQPRQLVAGRNRVSGTISVPIIRIVMWLDTPSHITTLMMGTEIVPETSVSACNQLTRLHGREDFIVYTWH